MKYWKNQFDEIIDIENIKKAIHNASKDKKDREDVKLILDNVHHYSNEIHLMLVNQTYTIDSYDIEEKIDKNKIRIIHKLDFYPHRIIQHAILQVMEKKWKPSLIKNTYQSIKHRGIVKCKRDVEKCLKRMAKVNKGNDTYVVKLDVAKYYPSVDNVLLKIILFKKIKCKKLLWLLSIIIDSIQGLPIGNLLSQYFGNIFLTFLDTFIKKYRFVVGYFRYCDDIVILVYKKYLARKTYLMAKSILNTIYNLELNTSSQYFCIKHRKLDFVGFVFDKLGRVTLRKSIKLNFIKCCKINDNKRLASYWGFIKEASAYNLWNKYYRGEKIWR